MSAAGQDLTGSATVIALGTARASDGAVMTTTGWITMGRAWVTEEQAINVRRFGWKRAENEPPRPFQDQLLYAVERP